MSRSHVPPQSRPQTTPGGGPRTPAGLAALALVPVVAVLAVARPAVALPAVLAAVGVVAAAGRLTRTGPRRLTVRVPVVSLRLEVALAPVERPRAGE